MKNVRVRFAPSPTGALHIGGVRTALYNYLFAKKHNGTFILRIEDTDQTRFTEGAEEYIYDALEWAGLSIDESPKDGGEFEPYKQSERLDRYKKYKDILIDKGFAYKAFDTPEELNDKREAAKAEGNHNWQYDNSTRSEMRNSLSLSKSEVEELESSNAPYVVRFKFSNDKTIKFNDIVRGEVAFQSNLLDDKVLFKKDGFPTYHLANVIDDHLMEISHVIRGEEWLNSTPLHVALYQAYGWEQPEFAHLPLILKPSGKGKLSKRDGAKFGFPVFPLNWKDGEEIWPGFKESGFLPEAFVNFLAFLGWNPGTEQELYTLEELIKDFDLGRVSKSGAQFNYDKAKWFNQQHIINADEEKLKNLVQKEYEKVGFEVQEEQLPTIIELFKERVEFISDFPTATYYLFEDVKEYDQKMIRKKWKPELTEKFMELIASMNTSQEWNREVAEGMVKEFMSTYELGFGQVLPALRLAICGTMKGPDIFAVMGMLPKKEVIKRLSDGLSYFNELKELK